MANKTNDTPGGWRGALQRWLTGSASARDEDHVTARSGQPARIGHYTIRRKLGEGGMGAVWRARNLDLDVEVALKLIRSDAALADGTDRLLRER